MPPRKAPAPQPEIVPTIGPPEAEAGARLTVDLSALQANWRLLGQQALPVDCAAVV